MLHYQPSFTRKQHLDMLSFNLLQDSPYTQNKTLLKCLLHVYRSAQNKSSHAVAIDPYQAHCLAKPLHNRATFLLQILCPSAYAIHLSQPRSHLTYLGVSGFKLSIYAQSMASISTIVASNKQSYVHPQGLRTIADISQPISTRYPWASWNIDAHISPSGQVTLLSCVIYVHCQFIEHFPREYFHFLRFRPPCHIHHLLFNRQHLSSKKTFQTSLATRSNIASYHNALKQQLYHLYIQKPLQRTLCQQAQKHIPLPNQDQSYHPYDSPTVDTPSNLKIISHKTPSSAYNKGLLPCVFNHLTQCLSNLRFFTCNIPSLYYQSVNYTYSRFFCRLNYIGKLMIRWVPVCLLAPIFFYKTYAWVLAYQAIHLTNPSLRIYRFTFVIKSLATNHIHSLYSRQATPAERIALIIRQAQKRNRYLLRQNQHDAPCQYHLSYRK